MKELKTNIKLSLRGERNEQRSNLQMLGDCFAPLRFARNDNVYFIFCSLCGIKSVLFTSHALRLTF